MNDIISTIFLLVSVGLGLAAYYYLLRIAVQQDYQEDLDPKLKEELENEFGKSPEK